MYIFKLPYSVYVFNVYDPYEKSFNILGASIVDSTKDITEMYIPDNTYSCFLYIFGIFGKVSPLYNKHTMNKLYVYY